MSEQTIFNALRSGGLSAAGACAVMGNMFCESGLKSNIVELRSSIGGADYTFNVDNGTITRKQFISDSFGYGLCQWTYSTRKADLYDYAKSLNVSIGDEKMQCDFCIYELQRDFIDLYSYLRVVNEDELYKATSLVCTQYERPAVNNIKPRYEAAKKYYDQLATKNTVSTPTTPSTPAQQNPTGNIIDGILSLFKPKPTAYVCDQKTWVSLAKRMPSIQYGDNSDAVKALQAMLNVCGASLDADGDWGQNTELAFEMFKGGKL